MEQGPGKSGCFCGLLRWGVGRHWLLRSQCTYFRQPWSSLQSAVVLIAFKAEIAEIDSDVPFLVCSPPDVLASVAIGGSVLLSGPDGFQLGTRPLVTGHAVLSQALSSLLINQLSFLLGPPAVLLASLEAN